MNLWRYFTSVCQLLDWQTPANIETAYLWTCSSVSPYQSCAWWRHQMETFSALLAICAGNSPFPVNSPQKGQWRGALMFSLICARINGWVNTGDAGDLRRHRTHYDVIVMGSLGQEAKLNVPWRLHGMETLSASLNLCEGKPQGPDGFPSQWVCKAFHAVELIFFFVVNLNKRLNPCYRDLRRHDVHVTSL